jgi:hypothetical protein
MVSDTASEGSGRGGNVRRRLSEAGSVPRPFIVSPQRLKASIHRRRLSMALPTHIPNSSAPVSPTSLHDPDDQVARSVSLGELRAASTSSPSLSALRGSQRNDGDGDDAGGTSRAPTASASMSSQTPLRPGRTHLSRNNGSVQRVSSQKAFLISASGLQQPWSSQTRDVLRNSLADTLNSLHDIATSPQFRIDSTSSPLSPRVNPYPAAPRPSRLSRMLGTRSSVIPRDGLSPSTSQPQTPVDSDTDVLTVSSSSTPTK